MTLTKDRVNMSTNKKEMTGDSAALGTLGEQPQNLPETRVQMTQEEMDTIAFERLSDDKKIIVEKLDGLLDKLSNPLRDVLDQAKNKPDGTSYNQSELNQIQKAVLQQLADLEKDISSKF